MAENKVAWHQVYVELMDAIEKYRSLDVNDKQNIGNLLGKFAKSTLDDIGARANCFEQLCDQFRKK